MTLNRVMMMSLKRMTTVLFNLALLALFCGQGAHAADRSFTRRFNANANGDIKLIGNTSMTCQDGTTGGGITCAAAQAGGLANNNDFTMRDVDIDSDSTTFNSSSADLNLSSGSNILWAGLYWGGQSSNSSRSQVLLSTPGSFGYELVTSSQTDIDSTATPRYSSFADVTAQVRAAGNGTYTVANIQSYPNNSNTFAGWSLVVVYGNYSLPLKNLAVFDGYQVVDSTHPVNINVNGFLTPLSGTVNTTLGAVTYEGDLNLTGDVYNLNGVAMSDATHAVNNFFNSSISDVGSYITTKNPNYRNQLGFDIAKLDVSGKLANGATSALFSTSTNSDQYYPAVLTFATDLYVPIITPNLVKTITKVNNNGVATLMPGDTIRFTVTMKNTGIDTATNLVLSDNIPAYTTYLPGSLKITSGSNSGVKSDVSGDDQAEYSATPTPHVAFRLGSGADTVQGGMLPYTSSTTLTFDATINSDIPAGTLITNTAQISYSGQTIATTYAGASSAATAAVVVPPTITKSFATNPVPVGGPSLMSIVVANPASNSALVTGVSFSDSYPAGLVNASGGTISCTGGSSGSLTGGVAGGNSIGMTGGSIAAGGSCTISVSVTSATPAVYTNTTGMLTSTNGGTGGTASATLSVGRPTITKAFSPATINAGGTSTVTFTLTNLGTQPLTGVAFSDPLAAMLVAGAPAVTNTCGGTVTANAGAGVISLASGVLAVGASCTITVNVTSSTVGSNPNQASGVTSTQEPVAGAPSNVAVLNVVGAPVASVAFSPSSVVTSGNGGSSRLSITVTNPNTATPLTGVAFTSTYAANLVNTTSSATLPPPNASISCTSGSSGTRAGGASGAASPIGLSGATLAAGGSCTVSVNVSSASAANYTVSTGAIASSNGSGGSASHVLNVTSLVPPTVSKAFTSPTITSGNPTTMTITLNGGNTITGVSFTDTYPAGLINHSTPAATTTCPGGVVTAEPGGTSLTLSGASMTGANCTVTVQVTSNSQGSYFNTLPAGTVTTANAGVSSTAASATLTVNSGTITTKFFATNPIVTNGVSRLNISVANPNTSDLTSVSFTDIYPSGMINTPSASPSVSCTGTSSATLTGGASGSNSIGITNGTIKPNEKCVVSVNVTVPTQGGYLNSTGPVNSNLGAGMTAVTTLTVMGAPVVAKQFSPAVTEMGAATPTRLSITFTNNNEFDITGVAFTDSYPSGMINAVAPAFDTTCGGTLSSTAGSLTLANGTVPANGSCTVSANVATTTTGSFVNSTGVVTTSNAGTAPAVTATLRVGAGITGFVYNDVNHNASMDGAETGTGIPQMYVKIATRSGVLCTNPALSAAMVDLTSGAYSILGVGAGDYCLILDDNSTLSDVSPTYPSGWLGSEFSTGVRPVTVSTAGLAPQNFGLYYGNSVTGKVFSDIGAGGGIANDGKLNGTEAGLPAVTIRLTNGSGDVVYDATTTDSSGNFMLHIPGSIVYGTTLKIVETNSSGFVSTGAEVGTCGIYDRAADSASLTFQSGTTYSGLFFADVPENRFLTDNTISALPGSVVFHPHSFTAGSAGSVSFATAAVASPTVPGWGEVLYRDTNCNGRFDSGEQQITSPLTLVANEQLCIMLKEFVPASAPMNSSNLVTLTATFDYTNASPALSRQYTRTDNTLVGTPTSAGLALTKAVDQTTALPGSNLIYTITYANNSSGPLNNIVIHDSVPAYTINPVACCVNPDGACLGTVPTSFPPAITACAATINGEAITWTHTGALAPGASGKVKFRVTVQP
ncbi:MAG: DUF11 domain-containing protein [Desulfuromonadales bacterium]|nr:DUF11 domain-containing protein [Desulfuromonadales bacterium]